MTSTKGGSASNAWRGVIIEFGGQVVEVELSKEYTVRVREMAAAEAASAADAAHAAELAAQHQVLADTQQQAEDGLLEKDKQLRQVQEQHQVTGHRYPPSRFPHYRGIFDNG